MTSKHVRCGALGVVALLGLSALSTTTAAAQSGANEAPKATDVGITAKEIHIAMIADVDSPIAPNLFKPAVDGVRGVTKYLNSKAGGGGLAGRKVVLDFYDSKLNPTETTNAVISACENDVAMIGTAAALLPSVDNMRNCKDSTGAVTGLPDLPFFAATVTHQCSDQSFPMQPPLIDCATKDQHPQTWRSGQALPGRLLVKRFGKNALHGIYVFLGDSKSAHNGGVADSGGMTEIGIASDADFDVSARAPQSAFTPVVQAMKQHGSTFGTAATASLMVNLRKEATLQGITGVKAWMCGGSCYDQTNFLIPGGADVEGTFVSMPQLPFYDEVEQKASPTVANFVKYTGKDLASGYGTYGWAAGLAFRDAVNAAVKAHGINGVTRKTIFEALNKIHEFDADGMFGTIDLAGRKLTNCTILLQVEDGRYVRIEPKKPGTFHCEPNAVLNRQLDLLGT